MKEENESQKDAFVPAIAIALESLSKLMHYAADEGYMSDYEALCVAADGIRALSGILKNINL